MTKLILHAIVTILVRHYYDIIIDGDTCGSVVCQSRSHADPSPMLMGGRTCLLPFNSGQVLKNESTHGSRLDRAVRFSNAADIDTTKTKLEMAVGFCLLLTEDLRQVGLNIN